MISNAVVYYHKLPALPLIYARVSMHKLPECLDKLGGYLRIISESHSLTLLIALVDPPSVCCNHLIVESLASVCAYSHSRKHLRNDLAVV